jgi:alpha-L-rhamnosidase
MTSTTFPDIRWHGHWIAPELPPEPNVQLSFGGDVLPHEFSRVLYRRGVDVGAVPSTVPARLTADSRYVLYVNGAEVGRGPIRSQPRRLRYDEYDLAPYLVAGHNTIAVLVTYYGDANAFWQPAPAIGGLGTDALLVFEARMDGGAGDDWLFSDDTWKVSRSTAWTTFSAESIDGVPVERLDARELPADWATTSFDDSEWATATIVKTSHIGGFAQSRPPTDPYGALLPRGIAALSGPVIAASVLTDSSLVAKPDWVSEQPAKRVVQVLDGGGVGAVAGSGVAGSGAAGSASLPVAASIPAGSVQHLSVDFGRILAGFVELDLVAPAGVEVELHYRELPFKPGGLDPASSPSTGAQYITRGSSTETGDGTGSGTGTGSGETYSGLELNGLRYLHVVVHASVDVDVTITGIRVHEYHYPWTGEAFFKSSDDELNALYDAGIRTVKMNSFDSFTDCPTREQRAWVGDGVVHQMVHFTTNTDWRLARNYTKLGDSPRPDHMLPMSVVGEIEVHGAMTIPDWSLHWVHGVYNLMMFDGISDELLAVLPTVEKVLRWYEPYVDKFGTISDVPEWSLVDWASVFSTGRSSILTALWARGLAEYAEISETIGNQASAHWARGRWHAARVGYEDFWDEARGTYVDHFLDGVKQPAASQAAGATAIVSGLAPKERWSRIIDTITDDATLVVRSWIGGLDGGYDLEKMTEQARGVQRIDWDAEREVVLAEPFFSYVVHDAVAAAGRAADLTHLMRRWSQFLVSDANPDGFDTFGECWGWGTPVHGWSSTPTRDLVSYVLGIRPGAPGYARVRVAPAPGDIRSLEGAVPTPNGLVTVSLIGDQATVTSPVGVTFVDAAGSEHELEPGTHVVAFR